MKGLPVRIGGARFGIAMHAIERYQERVRPALSFEAAVTDIRRLIEHCELVRDPPSWAADGVRAQASAFVIPTDDIAFPMVDGVLTTCLVRGAVGAEVRVVRSTVRRERKQRKRASKRSTGRKDARGRRDPQLASGWGE